ncbi:reverse transcriptase domain-containing protein [Tanacetum coccineum]
MYRFSSTASLGINDPGIVYTAPGTLLEEEIFAEFDEFMVMTANENSESESETEDAPFKKITINIDYKIKTSLEESLTDLELKPLPDNLEYVSPIHCKPKKGGITVVTNENDELVPTRTMTGWRFDDECQKAFESLNEKLTSAPVIVSPNWNLPVELMCDASDFAVGATRSCHPKSLILKSKMLKPRLLDGSYFRKNSTQEIKDRKGTENVAADHLSRLKNGETSDDSEANDNFPEETLMEINTINKPWFATSQTT